VDSSQFSGYPPDDDYMVIREDCCRRDTLVFDWIEEPPMEINFISISNSHVCKENTATARAYINNVSTGSIVFASGPSSITFADGTVHNYTYPDTITNQPFGRRPA
jgi:hypothetical protein